MDAALFISYYYIEPSNQEALLDENGYLMPKKREVIGIRTFDLIYSQLAQLFPFQDRVTTREQSHSHTFFSDFGSLFGQLLVNYKIFNILIFLCFYNKSGFIIVKIKVLNQTKHKIGIFLN